jgi:hypothetical protein
MAQRQLKQFVAVYSNRISVIPNVLACIATLVKCMKGLSSAATSLVYCVVHKMQEVTCIR